MFPSRLWLLKTQDDRVSVVRSLPIEPPGHTPPAFLFLSFNDVNEQEGINPPHQTPQAQLSTGSLASDPACYCQQHNDASGAYAQLRKPRAPQRRGLYERGLQGVKRISTKNFRSGSMSGKRRKFVPELGGKDPIAELRARSSPQQRRKCYVGSSSQLARRRHKLRSLSGGVAIRDSARCRAGAASRRPTASALNSRSAGARTARTGIAARCFSPTFAATRFRSLRSIAPATGTRLVSRSIRRTCGSAGCRSPSEKSRLRVPRFRRDRIRQIFSSGPERLENRHVWPFLTTPDGIEAIASRGERL